DVIDVLLQDRQKQIVLALEMPVDSGPGDAGGLSDLVDSCGVEASLIEQLGGAFHDQLPAGTSRATRRSGLISSRVSRDGSHQGVILGGRDPAIPARWLAVT